MILIFSGYNQRAVITLLRTITEYKITRYAIIACTDADPILQTPYKEKVIFVRKSRKLCKQEILFAINQLKKSCTVSESILIAPTTEALNRYLLEYREEFEKYDCVIPLVNKQLYENISNKSQFYSLCKNAGLCVPELIELEDKFFEMYVAKPKTYYSDNGEVYTPIIISNEIEHKDFIQKYNRKDFTFQRYISGESYYLLYYFSRNGNVYSFSQVNYLQQAGGKSILLAESSCIHQEDISRQYINFLLDLGYFGFIMIELRKENNTYFMIEANPRLWGPSQLYHDAGINFLEIFLQEYGILSYISTKTLKEKTKYFWSGGLQNGIIDDDNCIWLGNNREYVIEHFSDFEQVDIYKRSDTMQIYMNERLKWTK